MMKKHIIGGLLLAASAPLFTSCLEEAMPTDYTVQGQIDTEEGKDGLAKAIPYYLNYYSTDSYYDIGFAGYKIWRDSSTGDMPVYSLAYDYFPYVANAEYLGAGWQLQYDIWQRYYSLVQKCNLLLGVIDVDADSADAAPAATAVAYRANAYMEMSEWYEYKLTGYPELDDKAISEGILGLTVPIVTENTTEADARNNPRVPFYEMYRFILTDLNNGEKYVHGMTEPSSKMYAGRGLVYGLEARFWLTVGTRFQRYPEDLALALQHEDDPNIAWDKLGVGSAADCFVKAAEYARRAINVGYSPYTENQWFDPKTAFNTPNNSWIWANIISPDNGLATETWQSWVSFMSPESDYGVNNPTYAAYRMIDARLFGKIGSSDWRRATWIAPDDVGKQSAFESTYGRGTNLDYSTWKKFPAYVGFKYHPAQGNYATSSVGNAVSIPLMRVEEMYLIEAEAVGRSQGDGAGRQLLESFVNTYRYTDGSYKSTGSGIDGFIEDVYDQKRIEFWGEGLVMFDMRRLGMPVTRGYDGTNFPETTRFNTLPGYVAPWSTLCIPQSERDYNPAVKLNPDPSHGTIYREWNGE